MLFAAFSHAGKALQADLVLAIPRLRRYARVLTGDAASADDLVQETLARARKKKRRCNDARGLRLLLFAVMHDVHETRREATRRSLALARDRGEVVEDLAGGELSRGTSWPTPSQTMARLPVEEREVLLLVALEELLYEEVAATLSIPIATVMARLVRAREKLRALVVEQSTAAAAD